MKVRATKEFEKIQDKTVGRIRIAGEEFEVDEARAELLKSHNLIEIIIEEPKEEPKVEKPKRKTRKK